MTEAVIGVCVAAVAFVVGYRRFQRLEREKYVDINERIQANAAKYRPGMERPERRRFEIAGRRES
jgi:hypothetical protein